MATALEPAGMGRGGDAVTARERTRMLREARYAVELSMRGHRAYRLTVVVELGRLYVRETSMQGVEDLRRIARRTSAGATKRKRARLEIQRAPGNADLTTRLSRRSLHKASQSCGDWQRASGQDAL